MNNQVLDKDKYKNVVLYLLQEMGEIKGKKKAYKLLYFLDFDFYEAYEKSLTGETYTALPMGPAPRYFDGIIDELRASGDLQVSKSRILAHHENDTVIFRPSTKNHTFHFTVQEKKMLDRIVRVYG